MHKRAAVAKRVHDRLAPAEPIHISEACRMFLVELSRYNHPTARHLQLVENAQSEPAEASSL